MKTVIITGVGGFLGSHLCARLLDMGVKVIGIDIDAKVAQAYSSPNFKFILAGFEQYRDLHTLISDQVDVFFHFAWSGGLLQNSFWDYKLQLENAYFGCVAFELSNKIGCKRFINSGTNNQIEITQFLNSTDFTPRGTSIYSAAKMSLELICKTLATRCDTEFLGAMVPMPYGEGNRSMQLANVVMKKVLAGESPSLIEGENLYDMVYIDDIINGFIAIAEKGIAGRTYYIGHRKLKKFRDWMEQIRDSLNPNVELKFGEYQDSLNLDYSYVDLDLLYKDTGFEVTTDFETTILKTAQWIKINL